MLKEKLTDKVNDLEKRVKELEASNNDEGYAIPESSAALL